MEFYPVDPIGIDTYEVESLTGILCRIALKHDVSPARLLNYLHDEHQTRVHGSYAKREGRPINGCGELNQRILGVLGLIYPQLDTSQLSMRGVGNVFAKDGTGMLKRERHWCSACFSEDQTKSHGAYDRLIWQLIDLEVCPKHSCILDCQCPNCERTQHIMPTTGLVDRCIYCGFDFGEPAQRAPQGDGRFLAYQQWLTVELPKLLLSRSDATYRYTGFECSAFLKWICRIRALTPRQLAAELGETYESVGYTYQMKTKPRLRTWLHLCAELNTSPILTLIDPEKAAGQLPLDLPKTGRKPKRKPRNNRRERVDGAKVQAIVRRQLAMKRPEYSSVYACAEAHGYTHNAFYYYAEKETKSLTTKIANIRRAESVKTKGLQVQHGVAIIIARHQAGLVTNRKTFEVEMKAKVSITQHKVKDIFPICVEKALRKIGR